MLAHQCLYRLFVCATILCALSHGTSVAADKPARVGRVVGTSVEVVDSDGTRRLGHALAGAEFALGDEPSALQFRILSVVAEGTSGVWLHEVELRDSAGRWANICELDRDGRRLALFIEGYDLPDGQQIRAKGRVSVTCTGGVQAKCLRAGYFPWDDSRGQGSGHALFQTCTRMYRADYCGDGIGWTRNGTTIDPFDIYQIQRPEDPATLPFEAAWGPGGALCVHHTRVAERGDLNALLASCPRLSKASVGTSCSESNSATLSGALMFNRSFNGGVGGVEAK
jgi:hypothetical protein